MHQSNNYLLRDSGMGALKLIEAVQANDLEAVSALVESKENIEQTDDYGWTALNWASGKGKYQIIQKLLNAGANVINTGRDNRTPYQIALAAAHIDSAKLLQQTEQEAGIAPVNEPSPYCKAYLINKCREFPGWHEDQSITEEDTIVYIHQDHSVTASMWHGEDVIFSNDSTEWEVFCRENLAFTPPTDLDLAAEYANNRSA